jgi:hypothetical protein
MKISSVFSVVQMGIVLGRPREIQTTFVENFVLWMLA